MILLREECKIETIEKSLLPYIYIINAKCENFDLKMDIHEEVLIFEPNNVVEFSISTDKPKCNTSTDFCGTGNVVSIKGNDVNKLIVSIGGFLLVLFSNNIDFTNKFKPLMKVYIKLSRKQ